MATANGSAEKTVGYLKIAGINGECTDDGFNNWVKVIGWQWGGVSGSTVGQTSGSSGAGKVQHGPISVRVYLDSAGAEFWDMMNKGDHKDSLSMVIMRLGQNKKALSIDAQEVYCSSYGLTHTSTDHLPELDLNFTWGVAKVEYFKQDKLGNTVSTGTKTFDATTNKAS